MSLHTAKKLRQPNLDESTFKASVTVVPCRERTKLVYSMYSRMSAETVKRNLMKLGVDYFILEDSWCTRRTRYLNATSGVWESESSFPSCSLTLLCSLGLGAACQRSGTLRTPKTSVEFPSAPKCPGTHDPTSSQSFSMTFTKFSKFPKPPKISDNIVGATGHHRACPFFSFFLSLSRFCFLLPKNRIAHIAPFHWVMD